MAMSVNTNPGALTALQNLNSTNKDMQEVQQRVNTGLKVNGFKDNAAIFSIAQNLRSDQSGLNGVKQSLDNASSIVDVSLAAGEEVSNILGELKEKAVAAADPSLDSDSRNALNNEFTELVNQIDTVVNNAEFNGTNILDGSTGTVRALVSSELQNGSIQTIDVSGTDLTTATLSGNASLDSISISTASNAESAISSLAQIQSSVNTDLAKVGAGAKALESQRTFVNKLSDTIETGIGNLVDADLARESAQLQSLQVKQQLGTQALSIANQAPQTVLSLFG